MCTVALSRSGCKGGFFVWCHAAACTASEQHQELVDPEDELDDELLSFTEAAPAELLALGVASAASPCTALAPWRSAPRP